MMLNLSDKKLYFGKWLSCYPLASKRFISLLMWCFQSIGTSDKVRRDESSLTSNKSYTLRKARQPK